MSDPAGRPPAKQALGADLVIPGLGVLLAVYFFATVSELPWEAKANAFAIGAALLFLVAIFVARVALKVVRGEATLGFEKLFDRPSAQWKRLWLIVSLIGFVALLPWLGFTLSLFLGMLASMLGRGVREPKPLIGTATGVAVCCYLMFIALLDTNFPHGPVEALLSLVFGS
jgi:hypothetical protein